MSEGASREGTQFGPYRVRRLIGKGGMGEVYEAEDTRKDRIVALKVFSEHVSNDPVFRKRLQREAHSAGRLQEPHVVPIHDYGEIDGVLYVDMRMISGSDLRTLLKSAMTPARAVAIVRQVASALDAAHGEGLAHRDVKPTNILVTKDDFVYLVDFGIADARSDGGGVGTFDYTAPERFEGGEATYRADVYSLACVLYECLTGSAPYGGGGLQTIIAGHLMKPIPRPSVTRPGIPAALDDVIARGMAKQPEERYASAGGLAMAAAQAVGVDDGRSSVAGGSTYPQQAAPSAPPPPAPPPPPIPRPSYSSPVAQSSGPTPFISVPRPKPVAAITGLSGSVFAPPMGRLGDDLLVQVFIHLPHDYDAVARLAMSFDDASSGRGSGHVDAVDAGERLDVHLEIPGVTVSQPVQTVIWDGHRRAVQFIVSVPRDCRPGATFGTATVCRNAVPIGHVAFKLTITGNDGTSRADAPTEPVSPRMHHYRRAFISYASQDRKEVLKRVQMLDDAGIDYFHDVLSLKPGKHWESVLFQEIDRCDVFFLFWSSAARSSTWVANEVRHALQRNAGREDGVPRIIPVIIEGPPPVQPPSDWAHLHFNDSLIYLMQPARTGFLSRFRRGSR